MYDYWFLGYDFPYGGYEDIYPDTVPPEEPIQPVQPVNNNEPPPTGAPVPWQSVLDDLAEFLESGSNNWGSQNYGSDQNSYWDDGSNIAPWTFGSSIIGLSASSMNALGFNYFNFLTQDIDPEFLLATEGASFSTGFIDSSGSFASISGTALGGDMMQFTVNGITVLGRWHVGTGTPGDPDQIVVNGGHWDFDFLGYDFGVNHDQPLPGPPAGTFAPAAAVATTAAQAEQQVEAERLVLSQKLHAELTKDPNQLITFDGPDGTKVTFKLSEFVALLDKYTLKVDTTGVDYTKTTGGTGEVVVTPTGIRTNISLDGVRGYLSSPGGIDYLILHEVAHQLTVAKAYTDAQFQAWMASGGTRDKYIGSTGTDGSRNLYMSESYVNNIVRSLEARIGVPELANPGGTYNYTGTYAPPAPPPPAPTSPPPPPPSTP